ncbi:MAG: sigma 54-interacting transcriptional regulator [Kofleriaceae bacterium]
MADHTIPDSLEAKRRDPERLITRLVFIVNAEDPRLPSSYHSLDDLDEVSFHRGPRSATRSGRTLRLAFDDGRISSAHGRLRRFGSRWTLDDPTSRNGCMVDGEVTRAAGMTDGSVLELGRSFFVFRQTRFAPELPARFAGDFEASALPAQLATFSPALTVDHVALERLAPSAVSIVLSGETGTGKEVAARAIHALSRREGAFVAVNCGALPATLVEAELFGYRRGAFSGAVADRRGLIRSADGGTLFLDEIGELPLPAQAALLRVLQEREVVPIGDDRPVAVDLRIVAATLRDLDEAVEDERFRGDLRARLTGHTVVLPTLRERREDFGLLLSALLERLAPQPIRFAPAALRLLLAHHWPDNIRELEQVLRTAIALTPDATIDVDHLPASVTAPRPAAPPEDIDPEDSQLRQTLVAQLAAHAGNVKHVADALGKQRAQIYKWVTRLGIDLAAYRTSVRERE